MRARAAFFTLASRNLAWSTRWLLQRFPKGEYPSIFRRYFSLAHVKMSSRDTLRAIRQKKGDLWYRRQNLIGSRNAIGQVGKRWPLYP